MTDTDAKAKSVVAKVKELQKHGEDNIATKAATHEAATLAISS
jgi:hypothetical protein